MVRTTREERRRNRARKERYKKIIFWGILLAVLGLAGYFLEPVLFPKPLPAMAGTVIDVSADMSGFDQTEIHIKVGEPVTIRLRSLDNSHHTDGGGKHQLAVDELGINIIAQPLNTSYATFTPDQPGTYTFYCDICCGGRANPTMNGKLIVES